MAWNASHVKEYQCRPKINPKRNEDDTLEEPKQREKDKEEEEEEDKKKLTKSSVP